MWCAQHTRIDWVAWIGTKHFMFVYLKEGLLLAGRRKIQILPPSGGLRKRLFCHYLVGLKLTVNDLFQFKQLNLLPQAFRQLYHISILPHVKQAILAFTHTHVRMLKHKYLPSTPSHNRSYVRNPYMVLTIQKCLMRHIQNKLGYSKDGTWWRYS